MGSASGGGVALKRMKRRNDRLACKWLEPFSSQLEIFLTVFGISANEVRWFGNGGENLRLLEHAKRDLLIAYAELGISGLTVAYWRFCLWR